MRSTRKRSKLRSRKRRRISPNDSIPVAEWSPRRRRTSRSSCKPSSAKYLLAQLNSVRISRHQDHKKKLDALEAEKVERRRIRKEKIARGEDPGPDPDAPRSMSTKNVFRATVLFVVMALYAGYFIVGDPLWGYENKWLTTRHWASFIPVIMSSAILWFYQLSLLTGWEPKSLHGETTRTIRRD